MDKPIIFSAPMVQALLREIEAHGTGKTQTRRGHPPEPRFTPDGCSNAKLGGRQCWWDFWALDRVETHRFKLPYAVGDRLYVREAMRWTDKLAFAADDAPVDLARMPENFTAGRQHVSGMFMPRWASRITLLVTEVRVQRLQEISEADAEAEGVIWSPPTDADREWAQQYADEHGDTDASIDGVWLAPGTRQGWGLTADARNQPQAGPTAAFAYRCLWDHLHGPGAWALNPWVASYSFRPVLGNIDSVGATS